MSSYSGVFLITPSGDFIMQERDPHPHIRNPGRVGVFGGGAEGGETPVECAMREIHEEIGLKIPQDQLDPLGILDKRENDGSITACHFYVATDVDPTALSVSEGRLVLLDRIQLESNDRISHTCRHAVTMFRDRLF